jgi:hypothetical protein
VSAIGGKHDHFQADRWFSEDDICRAPPVTLGGSPRTYMVSDSPDDIRLQLLQACQCYPTLAASIQLSFRTPIFSCRASLFEQSERPTHHSRAFTGVFQLLKCIVHHSCDGGLSFLAARSADSICSSQGK